MSLSRDKGLRAYFAAFFAVFIWGAFPSLVKDALQFISVDQFLTLRFFISTLLFAWFLPKALRKLPQVPIVHLLLFIGIVTALFYSQTYILDQIPASWYVAVFTFVPIIFLVVYREPLGLLGWIGSVLSILGMIVFFGTIHHAGGISLLNSVLLIFSMLAWVAYSIMAKKLHQHLHDIELVTMTNLTGLAASSLIWSVQGFPHQSLSIAGIGLCILAATLLPLALVAYSFSLRYKPVFAMFSQYLEPVIGLLLAALLLGERMSFMQYIAAIIVIVGTLLVGIATRK